MSVVLLESNDPFGFEQFLGALCLKISLEGVTHTLWFILRPLILASVHLHIFQLRIKSVFPRRTELCHSLSESLVNLSRV